MSAAPKTETLDAATTEVIRHYIVSAAREMERTLVRTKWLVHRDAIEGVDYDLQRLTEVWVATTQQDAALVAITHSGTQDPAFEPGPYSTFTEPYVDQFARWYASRLAAHGV